MLLEGSCHCGAVRFSLESHTPQPYMRCYCSICRKTAGSGGFAINLGGVADSLQVEGQENLSVYRAKRNGGESDLQRHFCKICGSPLWCFSEHWPELIHPHASSIDTPLPRPSAFVDVMLDSAAPWVVPHDGDGIDRFGEYPNESIADWHKSRGLWVD